MTDQSGADLSAADDTTPAPEIDPIDAHNPPPAAAGDDTVPADAGTDTVEGGEGNDAPKPKQAAQARIAELTREKHELRRELERERAAKTAPAPQSTAADDEDPEPDPGDLDKYQFGETDPQYTKDLARWAARDENRRLDQGREQRTAAQTAFQAHKGREEAYAKDKPDFQDKVYKSEWVCTADMAAAIQSSDDGPAVSYHLANNPDEARRIAALSPIAQVRELGKIEARLAPASTTTTNTVSNAPPPPPALRGAGGKFGTAPDTTDFAAFERLADSKG